MGIAGTVLIARALGLKGQASESVEFADTEDIPSWAMPYVAAVKKSGLIQGRGKNLFYPQANATRAEVATLMLAVVNHLK